VPLTLDANYFGRNLYPAKYVTYTPDSINSPLRLGTINILQLASTLATGQSNSIHIDFSGDLYQTELLPQLKSVSATNAADLFQILGTDRFSHAITLSGNTVDDIFNFAKAVLI